MKMHHVLDKIEREELPNFNFNGYLEKIETNLFSLLSVNEIFLINSGNSKSPIIQNNRLKIPTPLLSMLIKLSGSGTISDEYRSTQTAIASLQNGEKRSGGLWVGYIEGFASDNSIRLLLHDLVRISSFFGDRFFPIASSGGDYYFVISLDDDNYGSVFGIDTYGASSCFEETYPTPEYLYQNIDAFLADLGPEKSYEETALPEGVTPLMS